MENLSRVKKKIIDYMNEMAVKRDTWIKRSQYYYKDLLKLFHFNIFKNSSILEIGCGTGFLMNAMNPSRGVGIDLASEMISIARQKYDHFKFHVMDAEDIQLLDTFDYVLISDTIGYFEDIQKVFQQLKKVCHEDTRIIITTQNFL